MKMQKQIEMENNNIYYSEERASKNDYNNYVEENIENKSNGENEENTVVAAEEPPKMRIILEPAVFLMYFAINLVSTIFQNQLLYQSCTTHFHYSAEDCEPLKGIVQNTNASEKIENIVQPYVAEIVMARSLIESILPAIISLFVGPWSDKFGRRPIMMITFIGYFVYFVITIIMTGVSLKTEFSSWLYLIPSVSLAVTGGSCAMLTVIYCYITDVAHERLKGLSLMLNDAAMGIGTFVGTLVSTHLFAATNTAVVSCVAAVSVVLAFLYIIFFVKESIPPTGVPLWKKIREFFHYDLLVDLLRTCFVKNGSQHRAFMWIVMLSLVITNFITAGISNVFYFFLRTKFNITVNDYSTYNAVDNVILIVGGIIGIVVFRKFFNISINLLAVLSLFCCLVNSIITAAAQQFWELYLGAACGFLGGIIIPMLLTLLSMMMPSSQIGKILALTTALQTVTPLGAAPLYTEVYNATLTYYPGMFNIISVGLYLLCLILITIVYVMRRKNGAKLA